MFVEEHLWGTASAITMNICLTKDWNKNIIGVSITSTFWKIISEKKEYKIFKNHKIKETFKNVFDQSTNSGS